MKQLAYELTAPQERTIEQRRVDFLKRKNVLSRDVIVDLEGVGGRAHSFVERKTAQHDIRSVHPNAMANGRFDNHVSHIETL